VINPLTFKVIDHFAVGSIPHHVAPAWDMSALYVDNEGSSSLTVINVHTGRPSGTINIPYPYNIYFTPDGTKAIDVVERLQRIEFRDPHRGWKLLATVQIPFAGADHMDFSADGSYLMISTEYTGMVAKVDVIKMKLVGYVHVGGLPIDVKLSPDGTVFLREQPGSQRSLGGRPDRNEGDPVHSDREGSARLPGFPGHQIALRFQPPGGFVLGHRLRYPQGGRQMVDTRRWQP